jgi:hypothetical protein
MMGDITKDEGANEVLYLQTEPVSALGPERTTAQVQVYCPHYDGSYMGIQDGVSSDAYDLPMAVGEATARLWGFVART